MDTSYKTFLREGLFIDGVWRGGDQDKWYDVFDPASGERLGRVPFVGRNETKEAIEAAHRAFESFKATTANERAALLHRLHDLILKNCDSLALLLTREQGKSLAEAQGEVSFSASYIRWYAEEARRVYGEVIPSPWRGRRILVTRHPIGVVGAITPWNFPSSMIARKLAPAIAAGCTLVIKPAPDTPFSGLAWGALCEEAGFPKGTVNLVTGDAEAIGGVLTRHSLVRKITFTGSTRVGKILLRQSARSVKKVSMELGGNAPFIVFNDADIDRAIKGAMIAKYRNSGQTCICTNRFYVQSRIYKDFVQRLKAATEALVVGNGREKGVTQGPLINEAAVAKCESLIADALARGGKIETGGKRHKLGGTFFEPTVISGAKARMRITQEEVFGPVSPVYKFTSEDEVVRLANDTVYGLAAYVYTKDLARAFRMESALTYGLIGINEGLITTPEAPFGGLKESGLGKEGGRQGIEDYLDTKYICLGGDL